MNFSFTPEQIELRNAMRRFAGEELAGDVVARDRKRSFSREMWTKCASFGIQGSPFPPAYGGQGHDLVTTLLALETLGYACRDNGLGFALGAQMWGVQAPINEFGSDDQKRRVLSRLCRGEWIGSHASSESDAGSDMDAIATGAVRDGDFYVLNGTKTFVSNAPVADVFLVVAKLETSGLTTFIVERGTPGVRTSDETETMGLRTAPMGQVVFEGCRVPLANRVGREGDGPAILLRTMEWQRGCAMAPCVGAMQRQLEVCVAHARKRQQFGQPIGKFQAIANRLVDMKLRWETSRALLYRMAWTQQRTGSAIMESAVAKLHISESWVKNCFDAIQVFGGRGYTTEYELERDLRDAVGGVLYAGTAEMQRALISQELGL